MPQIFGHVLLVGSRCPHRVEPRDMQTPEPSHVLGNQTRTFLTSEKETIPPQDIPAPGAYFLWRMFFGACTAAMSLLRKDASVGRRAE